MNGSMRNIFLQISWRQWITVLRDNTESDQYISDLTTLSDQFQLPPQFKDYRKNRAIVQSRDWKRPAAKMFSGFR